MPLLNFPRGCMLTQTIGSREEVQLAVEKPIYQWGPFHSVGLPIQCWGPQTPLPPAPAQSFCKEKYVTALPLASHEFMACGLRLHPQLKKSKDKWRENVPAYSRPAV